MFYIIFVIKLNEYERKDFVQLPYSDNLDCLCNIWNYCLGWDANNFCYR